MKAVAAMHVIKIDANRCAAMVVAWNRSVCSENETKMRICGGARRPFLNARECVFDLNLQQECGFSEGRACERHAPITMERGESYKVVRSRETSTKLWGLVLGA